MKIAVADVSVVFDNAHFFAFLNIRKSILLARSCALALSTLNASELHRIQYGSVKERSNIVILTVGKNLANPSRPSG